MQKEIKKLLVFLILSEVVLVFFHIYLADSTSRTLRNFFDLDREGNIPAWFSSMQFIASGLIAILIYFFEKVIGSDRAASLFKIEIKYNFVWLFIALIFVFLSFDEAVQVHEILDRRGDIFKYKWVYYYLPFAALIGIILGWFLYQRTKNLKRTFVLFVGGGALLGIGALGLELVDYYMQFFKVDKDAYYALELISEEFFEMIGSSLILCGFFSYLAHLWREVVDKTLPKQKEPNLHGGYPNP